MNIITSLFTSEQIKDQLSSESSAIASTVALFIESDADSYADFLETLDTSTEYYEKTRAFMWKVQHINPEDRVYIYTEQRIDDNNKMYIIDGESSESPTYVAPGVVEKLYQPSRTAYDTRQKYTSKVFVKTDYGYCMSAFAPIINPRNGEFLGLVGCDVLIEQFNETMTVLRVQSIVCTAASLLMCAVALLIFSDHIQTALSTDAMTRLFNKQRFYSILRGKIRGYSQPFYVIMADIDHFKKINDTYGHLFGDQVLKRVATVFRENLRNSDCPSRYGGEEFIACPDLADKDQVMTVIERIRNAVEAEVFHPPESPQITVTISIGAAYVPRGARAEDVIAHADKALYAAKVNRNSCVIYG